MRRNKILAIVLPVILIGVAAYVLLSLTHVDYAAGVNGRVTDSQGKPLESVRVTFRTAKPVYKAITRFAKQRPRQTRWAGSALAFSQRTAKFPTQSNFKNLAIRLSRLAAPGPEVIT